MEVERKAVVRATIFMGSLERGKIIGRISPKAKVKANPKTIPRGKMATEMESLAIC